MHYLDEVTRKQQEAQGQASQQQNTNMVLHTLQISLDSFTKALQAGQAKPSIILTDQTDLGDKLKAAIADVSKAIAAADTHDLGKSHIQQLKGLQSALEGVTKSIQSGHTDTKKQHTELLAAIKALKLDMTVNVPEPKVTVKETKIDFSPLQKTMREVMAPRELPPDAPVPEKFDLNRYRAQDIYEPDENRQYIGFLNPEGNWYIVENDVKANQMRYVFGSGGYAKAFQKASAYQYQLLDEAANAAAA